MTLDIPVFTPIDAKIKRGEHAAIPMICSQCENDTTSCTGVINKVKCSGVNRNGKHFETVVFERWMCHSCQHRWNEKYGVSS